jgi:hypothetical protein
MLLFIGVVGVIQRRGRTLITLDFISMTFRGSHDYLNHHELFY